AGCYVVIAPDVDGEVTADLSPFGFFAGLAVLRESLPGHVHLARCGDMISVDTTPRIFGPEELSGIGTDRWGGGFRDAWGNLILYRSPCGGKKGWTVYSCGPNGVDELGEGDDIVFSEDDWKGR